MTAVEIVFIALVLVAMGAFAGTLGLCAWWSDRTPSRNTPQQSLPRGHQVPHGT